MVDIARARLMQERWFALIRLLLIEAFLFQAQLEPDLARIFSTRQSMLLIAFGVYALIVVFGVAVRRTWPAPFAYATAAIDLVVAILVTSIWLEWPLNPGLVAVAAAGIAAGVRRFPLFETCIFSFVIAVGMPLVRFSLTSTIPVTLLDFAVIVSAALLPILARASTLAPQLGLAEEAMDRLADRFLATLAVLSRTTSTNRDIVCYEAAEALASHTRSQLAGVLIRNADDTIHALTVVGNSRSVDRLPAQPPDHLAARLLALDEPRILTRADNLSTRGLSDQYPPQLTAIVAAPMPDMSSAGAVLFTANPEGGIYTSNDRMLASAVAHEAARITVAAALSRTSSEMRVAATEALLVALEARQPGSREDGEECARIAMAIARQMGWSEPAIDEIRLAALLHNVGQLGLSDPLMERTDGLSTEESTNRRQHPADRRPHDRFLQSLRGGAERRLLPSRAVGWQGLSVWSCQGGHSPGSAHRRPCGCDRDHAPGQRRWRGDFSDGRAPGSDPRGRHAVRPDGSTGLRRGTPRGGPGVPGQGRRAGAYLC